MQIYEDVACPACGCVCDDLRVTVDGGAVVRVEGGCAVAREWFLRHGVPATRATAEIAGREVVLDDAIERSAELLSAAKFPLVTGLAHSSRPELRAAVALADALGATIDPAAEPAHAATMLAMQQAGMSTATLGEVRERADLLLFWGVDPLVTHPRLIERFVDRPGRFVPGGRSERTVVVIDEGSTATSKQADEFIPLRSGETVHAIATLRCLLRGKSMENATLWAALVQRMKTCRTGVIFFSFAALPVGEATHASAALLRLVRELNKHARFYARPLPTGGLTSAENVLAWQTGFPSAVNFSGGSPRYSPGETSAEAVLARGEADACVLVGSEGAAHFRAAARAHLATIPTIVLDAPTAAPEIKADVHFTTAVYGVHTFGSVYRLDDVPLPLRAILPAKFPSAAEVLEKISRRVGGLRGQPGG